MPTAAEMEGALTIGHVAKHWPSRPCGCPGGEVEVVVDDGIAVLFTHAFGEPPQVMISLACYGCGRYGRVTLDPLMPISAKALLDLVFAELDDLATDIAAEATSEWSTETAR